jgi:hypothetical protein
LKKLGSIFALFVFAFVVGYTAILHSTHGSFSSGSHRDPAAIQNVFDFSSLSGADLSIAMKKRLLSGAQVIRHDEGLGVELGHFAMQGFGGGKTLACQEYQKVTLSFSAEGMASSGEKPTMEVEGKCEFSRDMTKINPILIPVDKITKESPSDGELQFRDGKPVTVRFHGMTDAWPNQWLLTAVKLENENGAETITINSDEVKELLAQPMVLNFK